MINVNDKLIREELPKIGVDAFAVLMCITSHINRQNKAWPGIDRLRSMTGLSKERTYKAVKTLVDSGHIERKQKNHSGEFGHIVYRLTTQYLGVFMGVSSFDLPDSDIVPLAAFPEHGKPERAKPEHGKAASISINEMEVINKDEVINEGEGAPAQLTNPEQGNVEGIVVERDLSIEQLEALERGNSFHAQFHVQVHSLETIPSVEYEVPRPAARPTSKVSELQKNINAHGEAAEHFLRLIQSKGHSLNGAEKYAAAYFLNEQRKGRWVSLLIPADAGAEHRWLGEHSPGVIQWAQRQPQFERNNGQPAAPTTAIATGMRLSNPENAPR
jgi:hypothetical protein